MKSSLITQLRLNRLGTAMLCSQIILYHLSHRLSVPLGHRGRCVVATNVNTHCCRSGRFGPKILPGVPVFHGLPCHCRLLVPTVPPGTWAIKPLQSSRRACVEIDPAVAVHRYIDCTRVSPIQIWVCALSCLRLYRSSSTQRRWLSGSIFLLMV